jgi:hypothetical protein
MFRAPVAGAVRLGRRVFAAVDSEDLGEHAVLVDKWSQLVGDGRQ